MDWSLAQAFLAVADTGSLSAAARQLGQSQPTIGRHIARLEAMLGVPLFRRQARGMALTEAGATLVPAARAMHEAASRLQVTAAGEAEDLAGTIRLTCSVVFAQYVLPPILADLRLRYPEIAIELVASDTTENLLFREADIAVRMYRPEQLDMVTRHLGDVPLGFFAATTYLEARGRPSDFNSFLGHDLIGYDTSDLIIRGMRERGYPATRDWFVVRCDHQTVYWSLLQAGCGIGWGQRNIGRQDPLVEEIELGVDLPKLPVWLTTHEKLRQTPRIRRVWDHLVTHLSRVLDAP